MVTTIRCSRASNVSAGETGSAQRGIDDGHPDALVGQSGRRIDGHRPEGADGDQQDVLVLPGGRLDQDVDRADATAAIRPARRQQADDSAMAGTACGTAPFG